MDNQSKIRHKISDRVTPGQHRQTQNSSVDLQDHSKGDESPYKLVGDDVEPHNAHDESTKGPWKQVSPRRMFLHCGEKSEPTQDQPNPTSHDILYPSTAKWSTVLAVPNHSQ
ncbi:hypothetical protein Mapa_008123 [Marchantia paleacea]|nr:hypothetical protein Mapa_008123 [Marchantia paleacea]